MPPKPQNPLLLILMDKELNIIIMDVFKQSKAAAHLRQIDSDESNQPPIFLNLFSHS